MARKSRIPKKLTSHQIHQKYTNRYDYSVKKFRAGKIKRDEVLPKPSTTSESFKKLIVGDRGQNRGVVGSKGKFMSATDFNRINKQKRSNERQLKGLYNRAGKDYGYYSIGGRQVLRTNDRGENMFGSTKPLNKRLDGFKDQKSVAYEVTYYKNQTATKRRQEFREYQNTYHEKIIEHYDNPAIQDEPRTMELLEEIEEELHNMGTDDFLSWYLTSDEADLKYIYEVSESLMQLEMVLESLKRFREEAR